MRILTINTGSSSLKAALYDLGERATVLVLAEADAIGQRDHRLRVTGPDGQVLGDPQAAIATHDTALQALFAALGGLHIAPEAIGHRVVHGGLTYSAPQRITSELLATLERLVSMAPDHLPQAIRAIHAVAKAYPTTPQVACFDTAFHHHLPWRARQYALPRQFGEAGVVRYGFHGLSYEYILDELRTIAPSEATGRVVIAHLGNGASMAAVYKGTGVETTMGFTPAGGLVMGTRSGDLDPGVLLYLLQEDGMTPAEVSTIVNQQAGLVGISGTTGEMRELLARESNDSRAAQAIELFCYQAKKFLGGLAAVLGGLDALVFTGGIGEHAAPIRARICEGLDFLGIRLDAGRNAAHAAVISVDGSAVTVRVIKTDEDLMIARHTRDVVWR